MGSRWGQVRVQAYRLPASGGRCGNTLNQKAFHLDDEDGWYVRLINEFGPQKMFNIEVACSKCFNKLKSAQEAKSKPISDERRKSLEF